MDWFRVVGGVGVTLFLMVAPHLGLPYLDAIPTVGQDLPGSGGKETLARLEVEVGPRVALLTLDAEGERAPLRVLWAEVDGTKLDAAAKGQGAAGKVLLTVAAPGGLRAGEDMLQLRPGDQVAVDGFDGKWAYYPEGMVGVFRMEGTVRSAKLGEQGLRPVGTDEARVAPGWALHPEAEPAVTNVTVRAGRATFVSTLGEEQGAELRQLRARDVEVNGEALRAAQWGEGALALVSFTVAGDARLHGEHADVPLREGQRVTLADFIGGYVLFRTSKGEARVALEGYAARVDVADAVPLLPQAAGALSGNLAPVVSMDWQPPQPHSGQAVQFWDRSADPDGRVLAREWRFGDGTTSAERNPIHKFADNGLYRVTLLVTDDRRVVTSATRDLLVLNLPPEAGFAATPEAPSSGDAVQFVDQSRDSDGRLAAWRWDFGDGASSTEQHPQHRYADDGRYETALTVWDDDGETSVAKRMVEVRNLLPQSRFTWGPSEPRSGQEVQFRDASTDPDGKVVAWRWDFGDGATSDVQGPVHAFQGKGAHKVALTAADDDGGEHTWNSLVDVRNAAPEASLEATPENPTEGEVVRFADRSTDSDGRIVERSWNFGDGAMSGQQDPAHTYLAGGTKIVTLTIMDDDGARATAVKALRVNRRPVAQFQLTPAVPSTADLVRFQDASLDPDGRVVAWRWDFGDGTTSETQDPQHQFTSPGLHEVVLVVVDQQGGEGRVRKAVNVTNVAPDADFRWNPLVPTTGQLVGFEALGGDRDGHLIGWRWDFGDGTQATGRNVTKRYDRAGSYDVMLTVTDDARGEASARKVVVVNAAPIAGFAVGPGAPAVGSPVRFSDTSTDPDGRVVGWMWEFGDGSSSGAQHPSHTYAQAAVYHVSLRVTDDQGGNASVSRPVVVGSLAPRAAFRVSPAQPQATQPAQFTDASTDPDGRVTVWKWDFGDGALSSEPSPQHAFATPGTYAVVLRVTDDTGKQDSARQLVQVFSAEPLDVVVRVAYPDGQPLDLSGEGVVLEVRETASGARLTKGGSPGLLAGSDGVARGTFPAGAWSAGDLVAVVVRISAAAVDQSEVMALPGHGDLGTVYVRMPMTGRFVLQPSSDAADPSNTYTDPSEQVTGVLKVSWRDGHAVRAAAVSLSYEWLQLGTYGQAVPNPVKHSLVTDSDGLAHFAVPFNVGAPDGPGAYLPGAYRIQGAAEKGVADGIALWRAPFTFQEDPLGLRAALRSGGPLL